MIAADLRLPKLAPRTVMRLPLGLVFARKHRVRLHARFMTGLFNGGLVLAGLFAFVPGRLMWTLFFG